MVWYFRVRGAQGVKAHSRILQILDAQLVEASEFEFFLLAKSIHLHFRIVADEDKARRIGLLVRRLNCVSSVVWLPLQEHEAFCRMDRFAVSLRSSEEEEPQTDPESDFWRIAPSICMQMDNHERPVHGHQTEVRLRWTNQNLYFLFVCSYQELQLRRDPPWLDRPTPGLWTCDVAEVFVGSCSCHTSRYCEFELSPRGEWLDLNIEILSDGDIESSPLHLGLFAEARVDEEIGQWFGFLRVPHSYVIPGNASAGDRLRINFFRSQGTEPIEVSWQPTHNESFHVPASFGTLLLAD